MKVAVFNTKSYEREFLEKFSKKDNHQLTYFENALNEEIDQFSDDFEAVCVFVTDKIDKITILKLAKKGIKLIDLRCAGYDNIDILEAQKNNIKIMRVPAYSPEAIAEHAVALILTLNRKTHKAYNQVRENNFSIDNQLGFNLFGKTVGVVGTGKIGIAFCKIMLGFGCHVLAEDFVESEELKLKGVVYKTFDEILKNSDIISIHCPLNPTTKHLFDKNAFAKIKNGVMLINTGRGAIIKTTDAIEAIKNGKIGYLGIDVYEQEEDLFFKDLSKSIVQDDLIERLISFNNVLVTPHQGFFTHEALEQIAKITIQNFTDFQNGKASLNEINS